MPASEHALRDAYLRGFLEGYTNEGRYLLAETSGASDDHLEAIAAETDSALTRARALAHSDLGSATGRAHGSGYLAGAAAGRRVITAGIAEEGWRKPPPGLPTARASRRQAIRR